MRLLLPPTDGPPRELADDDLPDLYAVPHGAAGTVLRAGFVVALDGTVAVDGSSRGLSGPADLAALRTLRTVSDAVLVGAGTARREDYRPVRHRPAAAGWRAGHGYRPDTPVVVVSRTGRLDPRARLFAGPAPVVLVVPEQAEPVDLPAQVVRAGRTEVDLPAALTALHDRGLRRLVCEGGPRLLTDLLAAGLVDELCLTLSPALVGGGPALLTRALTGPTRLRLVQLIGEEPGFLLARYRRDR